MTQLSDSRSKRDEIIEVASKLFYEQGYHRTGIQQIIQEAGTAKGTFYTHFKSKEELGIAWLQKRHATWNSWLQKSLNPNTAAKKRILLMFDFLGDWMQQSNFRGCAFLNTMAETPESDNPLRLEIAGHKRDLLERFKNLVHEHNATLKKKECERMASTLFILFEGALIEMQNFQELWPLEAAKTQATHLLQK